MKARAKHCDVSVVLTHPYGRRETEFYLECPGRCQQARFYLSPPEKDESCAFEKNGSCTNPEAQRLALDQLAALVNEEMEVRSESADEE